MRHGLLHLVLDVPDDAQLLTWAHAAHKPLNGHVTFFETNRQIARETVSSAAGQCVGYQETFVAGDGAAGAYGCQLGPSQPARHWLHHHFIRQVQRRLPGQVRLQGVGGLLPLGAAEAAGGGRG